MDLTQNINTLEDIQDECYRRYQLHWMLEHGYSAENLATAVLAYAINAGLEPGHEPEIYDDWLLDAGFNGSLWAGKAEFLKTEFKDFQYMYKLLPDSLYSKYWRATHNEKDEWIGDGNDDW